MTSSPVVRDSVENLRKRSMISARSSRKYYKNCVRMWQQEQQKNHLLPEGDLYWRWTGAQRDVARCTKAGEKNCYWWWDIIRKQNQNIAELSYQNLITIVTKYALFPLRLNHPDVYLFFSGSLNASLSGQIRKEQIKMGILELIDRKSHLLTAWLSSWSFSPLALRTTTVRRPRSSL